MINAENKQELQLAEDDETLKSEYMSSLRMIERLHRLLLDVVKDEFERHGCSEVNSIQALLLYNIGESELSAGELRSRGYYLGSNVSYNLKKLVEMGYINQERSDTDRRSVRIRLTEKGQEVCDIINGLYGRQLDALEKVGGISEGDLSGVNKSLLQLERYWTDQIRFRL
ncbi:MAG: MarR family transcriptional regulator [Rhodomicrobium sp.]|nr:MAG: MarR family transcriptional regulator [Rhodomicrobium sp.]